MSHKNKPLAVVVQNEIENHCRRFTKGFASAPPMRTLPAGMIRTYLDFYLPVDNVFIINGIICAAFVFSFLCSSLSGIKKGILFLSGINVKLIIIIVGFIAMFGPMNFVFSLTVDSFQYFANHFVSLNLLLSPSPDLGWYKDWPAFFFCSWLSWAPLTGLFLGKLSVGYTIREIVLINLILPSVVICLITCIVSGSSIYFNQSEGNRLYLAISHLGPQNAMLVFFEYFPYSKILQMIVFFMSFISFVTATDSNIIVISSLCLNNRGQKNKLTTMFIKIIWSCLIGVISWFLISYAGVDGLRILCHLGGAPALFILLFMTLSLVKIMTNKSH